jgi:hypothetical protein
MEEFTFNDSYTILAREDTYLKFYYASEYYYIANMASYVIVDKNTSISVTASSEADAREILKGIGYPDKDWYEGPKSGIKDKEQESGKNDSSQARTTRRNNMSRILSQLNAYSANNRKMPTGPAYWKSGQGKSCTSGNIACMFIENYLEWQDFEDPDGKSYGLMITENISSSSKVTKTFGSSDSYLTVSNGVYTIGGKDPRSEHMIYVLPGSSCNADSNGAIESAGKRNVSVLYYMDDSTYCISND